MANQQETDSKFITESLGELGLTMDKELEVLASLSKNTLSKARKGTQPLSALAATKIWDLRGQTWATTALASVFGEEGAAWLAREKGSSSMKHQEGESVSIIDSMVRQAAGPVSVIDVLTSAIAKARPQESKVDESRFPVVVSGETRAFLDAQATVLGTSLAGLCGTILNEVVSETKRRVELGRGTSQP